MWLLQVITTLLLFSSGSHAATSQPSFEELANFRSYLNWNPEWTPKIESWQRYMDRKMAQVARIEDDQQKFDGYLVAVGQGLLMNNYSTNGYHVVDCPKEIYDKVYKAFHDKYDKGQHRYEGLVDQIHCENEDGDRDTPCQNGDQAIMVNTGLNNYVLQQLKPLHEEWSNVELTPSIAYGIRVYQNGSSLTMHTDRIETHVISCIFHIDRDYGGKEPWPIVIEGFDGITRSIDLKPGQLLFYESAKCMHGRPVTFRGNWYASMFVHYRPKNYFSSTSAERVALVPENWRDTLPKLEGLPDLTVYGTGFKERSCEHGWCELDKSELKHMKNEDHLLKRPRSSDNEL